MSINDSIARSGDRLAYLPSFHLSYGVDDVEEPTRITVYSKSVDEFDSHWISIDADRAIDLADVA